MSDPASNPDFSFVCGRNTVKAHSALLAARSPYFKTVFAASGPGKRVMKMVIKDCTLKGLQTSISYMYGVDFENVTCFEELCGLLEFSERFMMSELKDEASKLLAKRLKEKAGSQAEIEQDTLKIIYNSENKKLEAEDIHTDGKVIKALQLAKKMNVRALEVKICDIIAKVELKQETLPGLIDLCSEGNYAFNKPLYNAAAKCFSNIPGQKVMIQSALSLDLNFLEPSLQKMFPNVDTPSLLEAYKKFLAIKVVCGDTACPQQLSPSPLIDQVWHLHLLRPRLYIAACRKIGEGLDVIDHNPDTANNDLRKKVERFRRTKAAYKLLFGEEAPCNLWSYFTPEDVSVTVKTLTGNTHQIFINLTDSVQYLKMKIQEAEGMPTNQQRIIFAGHQLEDHDLLSDRNVKNGDVLHVVGRLAGC